MITKEKLESIICNGELDQLRALCRECAPEERTKFHTVAAKLYDEASKDRWLQPVEARRWNHITRPITLNTAMIAALLFASEAQLRKFRFSVPEEAIAILQEIKPSWLPILGDILLEHGTGGFLTVRKLMKLDLIDKPKSENYFVALFAAPRWSRTDQGKYLTDYLLANEDLLEDVWRLFEIEGDQEHNFASADKYTQQENTWETAFMKLSEEGILSRERLLTESLVSLDRGFIQFRAGWFSRFHEKLKPTIDEREYYAETYAKLLASSIPPTVSFALKALSELDSKDRLSEELLLKYITPALMSSTKGTVISALKLLERAAKRNPSIAGQVCTMAAESLQGPSADVQAQVIKFLKKNAANLSPLTKQRLLQLHEGIAVSLKSDFDSLIDSSSTIGATPTANTSNTTDAPSVTPVAKRLRPTYKVLKEFDEGWPFETTPSLEPIEFVDDLISRASYSLEHPEEPIEFELVVDAVSRLSAIRQQDFAAKAAALKKRAKKLASAASFSVHERQRRMAKFIFDWLEGSISTLNDPEKRDEFHTRRLQNVLKCAFNSYSIPLMSTPTHSTGWIDPAVLIERELKWKSGGIKYDEFDLALALLRIPPLQARTFLQRSKPKGEFWDALAYSLEPHNAIVAKVQELRSVLWRAATWIQQVNADPSKTIAFNSVELLGQDRNAATSLPALREALYAKDIRNAVFLIDYQSSDARDLKPTFMSLTESGAPLQAKAMTMLAIGLNNLDPELSVISRDALILAIEEGRLNLNDLARELSKFLHSGRNKPKRMAASLLDISRVSELHANAVRQLIQLTLHGDGKNAPKDISAVLELLNELLIEEDAQIDDPETVVYLKSVTMGGKTGALIKALSKRFPS